MMTKRSLYWMNLWLAACSLLLSTVILHHHHSSNQICFAEELCQKDDAINDEHTHHHGQEQEGCRLHQMHQFLVNAKIIKSIHKSILDGGLAIDAVTPYNIAYFPQISIVITLWQEGKSTLTQGMRFANHRRGPPHLSYVTS